MGVVEVALQQISRQGTGCRTGASIAAHRTARRHFSIGLAPLGGVSTSVRGSEGPIPQFLQAAVIVSAACIYSAIRAGSWFSSGLGVRVRVVVRVRGEGLEFRVTVRDRDRVRIGG